jgi:hypothetical protein
MTPERLNGIVVEIDELKEKVQGLSVVDDIHSKRCNKMESKVSGFDARFDTLEERLDELKTTMMQAIHDAASRMGSVRQASRGKASVPDETLAVAVEAAVKSLRVRWNGRHIFGTQVKANDLIKDVIRLSEGKITSAIMSSKKPLWTRLKERLETEGWLVAVEGGAKGTYELGPRLATGDNSAPQAETMN